MCNIVLNKIYASLIGAEKGIGTKSQTYAAYSGRRHVVIAVGLLSLFK